MKVTKRGSISKKLGIPVAKGKKLTKKECLEKVRILTSGLKRNKYKGELREYALYYKGWYKWRSTHERKSA